MLARNISDVDQSAIRASVQSKTRHSSVVESNATCIKDTCMSATYYDTVGFDAREFDSAYANETRWDDELRNAIQLREQIHKILIVQKIGRARGSLIRDTRRIVEALREYGAARQHVYIALTFAYDYNEATRERLRKEVVSLFAGLVDDANVFYSYYLLLQEVDEKTHPHYVSKIKGTHAGIYKAVMREVEPFQPVVATFQKKCGDAFSNCNSQPAAASSQQAPPDSACANSSRESDSFEQPTAAFPTSAPLNSGAETLPTKTPSWFEVSY